MAKSKLEDELRAAIQIESDKYIKAHQRSNLETLKLQLEVLSLLPALDEKKAAKGGA